MNYLFKEMSFPSSDGINTIHAEVYEPKDGNAVGVVQISHGMIDYVARYKDLADYLTGKGFVVAGNDHLGHGGSVKDAADFGYFAKNDGYKLVVDDLYRMNKILKEEYKDLPVFLLGHSMGSFMARLYAAKYPESISGIIIHGTGGKNPLLTLGKAVIGVTKLFCGGRHRSRMVTALAFGSYNSTFPKEEGMNAWLTRDLSRVADRDSDERTNYIFTLSAYKDLFTALGECNSEKWYSSYPIYLPTLIMSGDADPVGNYGKGVREVYEGLSSAGVLNLRLKIYEGARHELFNETNREQVYLDIYNWLASSLNKK